LLDAEGQPVSSTSPVANPSTFNSSLALTPFGYATSYTRHPEHSSSHLDRDVFLRLLSPDGDLLTEEVQVAGRPGSNYSHLVSNGSGLALVWQGRHNAIYFTAVSCTCGPDEDGDGAPSCSDCDDADPSTHDNARQLCDGKNNQCDDPWWPAVPDDTDGDGWASACDNCLDEHNPSQSDFDLDGRGDSCEVGTVLTDANESGRTDGFDLVLLARAFGSHRGDPNYSPSVDLDMDDDVDGADHTILATFFGQSW
jgi:hypothetical protein